MNAIQTTFSLLFVIRKHRLLKNGEASIYLRITVNGEVADITTKRSVRPEMWDQRRECSLGKLHRDKELNHYLETLKTRMYQLDVKINILDILFFFHLNTKIIEGNKTSRLNPIGILPNLPFSHTKKSIYQNSLV